MVRYILRFTKYADGQLNTIYTDKRVYTNKLQFTEEFEEWNYELLQYVRPSTFYNANARGSISMGRIGELFYQIYEVGGINIVVVEKFYFKWLPFTTLMAVASSKNRLCKIDDAGYSYSIIQDSITKKMAIRKPNSQYLTKFVFDEIIGFHHSTEDYNKIHAIGFIGDRVYSIPLDGELKLLHMSKNDYLSMKHRYDEMLRKRINIIIENLRRQHNIRNINIRNNNTKRQYTMKQRIRLTEGDLHRMVRQCVNEALNELDWKTYANASEKARNRGTNYWKGKERDETDLTLLVMLPILQ